MSEMKKFLICLLIACVTNTSFAQAPAPTAPGSTSTCPNANILGVGLISKVCWSCIFPIVLLSVPVGGGKRPAAANTNLMCTCEMGSSGIHMPGFSAGLRSPARMMEVVRNPGCSPTLGGIKLFKDSLLKGRPKTPMNDGPKYTYLNANSWSFPLLYMMEMLLHQNCTGDSTTINLIGLSSVSPTWSNDELAFHLQPESTVFSNPEMLFFGIADGIMVSTAPDVWGISNDRDTWFWAIGSWSASIYPLTGNVPHATSSPRESSLVAARSLALSHRVGQSRKTMGSDNMCGGGSIYPMLPKTQYKFQHIYPVPNSSKPCCNYLGESNLKWNEWRTLPGYEDYLYLVFRWTDCCITLM